MLALPQPQLKILFLGVTNQIHTSGACSAPCFHTPSAYLQLIPPANLLIQRELCSGARAPGKGVNTRGRAPKIVTCAHLTKWPWQLGQQSHCAPIGPPFTSSPLSNAEGLAWATQRQRHRSSSRRRRRLNGDDLMSLKGARFAALTC